MINQIPKRPTAITLLAAPLSSPFDLFGPAEVFAQANSLCDPASPAYRIEILAVDSSSCETSVSGAQVSLRPYSECVHEVDTLLIAGGLSRDTESKETDVIRWLRATCSRARRFGAICSGNDLLAKTGLLRDRRVTTHWSLAQQMSRNFPEICIVPDCVYIRDGNCYTAAGAASAIDLALELVTEDLGREIAHEIARRMVLFLRRSGVEPQISATIRAQESTDHTISRLLVFMADNLTRDLSVARLARYVAMSPRNFARHFVREVHDTPAKYVVNLRLEAARSHLSDGSLRMKDVATASGFRNAEVLRRLFTKSHGMSPMQYRQSLQSKVSFVA